MHCAYCPVAQGLPCLGLSRGALCRRAATGEPSFLATLVRHAEAEARGPGPTEADLLRGMRCPHQRLCGCAGGGYDCLVSGERVTPSQCGGCLYHWSPIE